MLFWICDVFCTQHLKVLEALRKHISNRDGWQRLEKGERCYHLQFTGLDALTKPKRALRRYLVQREKYVVKRILKHCYNAEPYGRVLSGHQLKQRPEVKRILKHCYNGEPYGRVLSGHQRKQRPEVKRILKHYCYAVLCRTLWQAPYLPTIAHRSGQVRSGQAFSRDLFLTVSHIQSTLECGARETSHAKNSTYSVVMYLSSGEAAFLEKIRIRGRPYFAAFSLNLSRPLVPSTFSPW